MGDHLKPKRGWVWPSSFEDAHKLDTTFLVDPSRHRPASFKLPVLVIPDPDREPTANDVEAMAWHFCAADEAVASSEEWGTVLSCARAAWKLGARVPS